MATARREEIDNLFTKFKSDILEIVDREDERNRREEILRIQELERKNRLLLEALSEIAGLPKSASLSRVVQLAKRALANYYSTSWSPEPSESTEDCGSVNDLQVISIKSEVEEAGYITSLEQPPETDSFSNSASNSNLQDTDLLLPSFGLDPAEALETSILEEEPVTGTLDTYTTVQSTEQTKKLQQTLTYPCALPPLTGDLLKAHERGQLLESQKAFLKYFVQYFTTIEPKPTKRDYKIFTRTVVDNYPVFRNTDPSGYYWSTFHQKFLTSLQNRQSYQRSRDIRRAKAMLNHRMKRKKSNLNTFVEEPGSGTKPVETVPDNEEILRCFSSKDITSWKQLLALNFTIRRVNMKQLLSPRNRLSSYSYFSNREALLAEFDLASGGSLATFEAKFKALLAACSTVCDNCNSVTRIIELMTDKMANNRLELATFPCFVEKEVGAELADKIPEDASPFVVVYKEGDIYRECRVVGFGQVLLAVKEVQLWEAFLYVVATYYVFGFDYPETYTFLNLVDEFTIRRSEKDRVSFRMAQNWQYVQVSASIAALIAKRNLPGHQEFGRIPSVFDSSFNAAS